MVADADAARGEVAAVLGPHRGRASIGTIQALTTVDLPRELGEFRRRHEGVQIRVRDGLVPALAAAVAGGELDLAYLAEDGPLPPVRRRRAAREPGPRGDAQSRRCSNR